MNTDELLRSSKDELILVLSFFSRVESKSSVLLAIDIAMLGFLATNAPPLQKFSIWMAICSLGTVLFLAISVLMLYRAAFPQLSGGNKSLVYFREIASRTQHKFIEEFTAQQNEQYAADLLGQVWRNSEILSSKFDCLKQAFIFLALSIAPWVVTIALFAATNNGAKSTFLR